MTRTSRVRMPRAGRVAAAVLPVALLAGGVTACGTATSGSTTTTAPFARTGAVAAATGGDRLLAAMTGAMRAAGSAKVTFTSSAAGQQLSGSGALRIGSASHPALAADLSVALPTGGSMRVVVLPTGSYLQPPPPTGLPDGKSWIGLTADATDTDPMALALRPMLDRIGDAYDPAQNLRVLRATTRLRKVGTAMVDGVRTTEYRATVDVAKALRLQGGPLLERYGDLRAAGIRTLRYSLWVDDRNLPHKFRTTVPTSSGDVTASGTYRDWGAPVRISAPPATEVASLGSLALH